MNAGGFVLREAGGVPFYCCAALEELPGLRHGFSTRRGGLQSGTVDSLNLSHLAWDAPERVEENRRRFLSALALERAQLVTLAQVHSDRLHIIEEASGQGNRRRDGDALATRQAGVALAVQVADCLPILIADPETGAIAAIHSGWRGTLARILKKTIGGMRRFFGSDPARLLVAVGPGIRSCCFEVGPEVVALFEGEYPGVRLADPHAVHRDRHYLDLGRALGIQCAESGLRAEQVFDLRACTRCHPNEFFSYRAEGGEAGRMMAIIGRI